MNLTGLSFKFAAQHELETAVVHRSVEANIYICILRQQLGRPKAVENIIGDGLVFQVLVGLN